MCSAHLSPHDFKSDVYYKCNALVWPNGLKNYENYRCDALVSPHGLKNDVNYMCSAFFWPHVLKNDVCFMCSALVSPHDEYYMCKVLASPHRHVTCVTRFISWFKRPISHVCRAWFASKTTYYMSRTTYITNVTYVAPLFRLMAFRTTYITSSALVSPHFYVCCELTFRWVRSTLARTSCLHRIQSSLFANIVTPLPPCSC